MTAKSYQVGVIGVSIILYITEDGLAKDISAATQKIIRIEAPNGTSKDYPASFLTDGHEGGLVYATASANDLYMAGTWKVQALLILGSFDGPSAQAIFDVKDNEPIPL